MEKENIVNVMTMLFQQLEIRVSETGLREEISKYPEPNSLEAIGILLNNWKVSHEIKKIRLTELSSTIVPFIIIVNKKYVLVLSVAEGMVVFMDGQGKRNEQELNKFIMSFSGSILIPKKNPRSGERAYKKKHRKEKIERLRNPVLIICSLLILSLYLIGHYRGGGVLNFRHMTLISLKAAGLVVTIILLIQSVDDENPFVQKLCGTAKDKQCNAILSSEAAKITTELSWSEIGFFYFAGSFFVLIFNLNDLNIFGSLTLMNVLCLPYTVYSIFYQWRIAKQWCIFCCIVQGLFWLEFLLFLPYWPNVKLLNLSEWVNILLALSVPILFWIFLKPFIAGYMQTGLLRDQLFKYKYNRLLFYKLLEEEAAIALLPDEDTLILGNTKAKTTITMVSNPYCAHCANMHRAINRWLPGRKDIKLQIVFSATNKKSYEVAYQLMSIKYEDGNNAAKKALHAWYLQKQKNFASWIRPYNTRVQPAAGKSIELQNKWCRDATIVLTPTFFVNGHKLSKIYHINDIKYLI